MKPTLILVILCALSACANHTDKVSPCFSGKTDKVTVSTKGSLKADCKFRPVGGL